jgi:pimeloyl-ACP methyl ester carboxylesterase
VQPTEVVTHKQIHLNGSVSGLLSSIEATHTSFDPTTQQQTTVSIPVNFLTNSSFFDLDVSLNPEKNTITVVGKDTNGVVQCTVSLEVKKISPILFLHGFNSSSSTWDTLVPVLEADPVNFVEGEDFFRINFADPNDDFLCQGREVEAKVFTIKQHTGEPKVTLVGHSMGGLASRAYLQSAKTGQSCGNGQPPGVQISFRHDIDKLITIGTPHNGALFADLISLGGALRAVQSSGFQLLRDIGFVNFLTQLDSDSRAAHALETGSIQLDLLNTKPLPPEVVYKKLVGRFLLPPSIRSLLLTTFPGLANVITNVLANGD